MRSSSATGLFPWLRALALCAIRSEAMTLDIHLTLLSDGTFGRGDGVASLVDEEVEYNPQTGLPEIGARRLKGLLVEECANILFGLNRAGVAAGSKLEGAAQW